MTKKGVTLIELMVALMIGGIMLLAMTSQFVAEQTMRYMVRDQVSAMEDAAIAMRHMAGRLRFAEPGIEEDELFSPYVKSVSATIEGGHLPNIAESTEIVYGQTSDGAFEYTLGENAPLVIARHISHFDVELPDSLTKELTIELTATKGTKSSSLLTKIRTLPE